MGEVKAHAQYRGRLAPTPSGYLHPGNISTFQVAMQRARDAQGKLFLRMDDLDATRCKKKYFNACIKDMRNAGLKWNKVSNTGNDGFYRQSSRMNFYLEALQVLIKNGIIYPCSRTRSEIRNAGIKCRTGEEYLFPEKWRCQFDFMTDKHFSAYENWRIATNWGERITFKDGRLGNIEFEIGKDLSDFLVWRKDGFPTYELATVVDDHLMEITEIVRGEDLLVSSARQKILFKALSYKYPRFYHCEILYDKKGKKLSKTH